MTLYITKHYHYIYLYQEILFEVLKDSQSNRTETEKL